MESFIYQAVKAQQQIAGYYYLKAYHIEIQLSLWKLGLRQFACQTGKASDRRLPWVTMSL